MVACQRAIAARDPNPETRNPDYLAEKLLDAELMALVPACRDLNRPFEEVLAEYTQRRARGFFAVVARTKHIDQSLQVGLANGVRQVVILGSGLDSRAYRMGPDHKGVRFFEVDSPATQEDKKQRVIRLLGSLPRSVVYVPVDFETQTLEARLSEAGFQAGEPAFFVWEGVTMYLNAEAVDATLDYIGHGTAPGSSIIFDYIPTGVIDGTSTEPPAVRARRLDMLKRFGEPYLFGVPDGGIGDLVRKHGLELVSNVRIRELWDRYLRAGTADAILGEADPEGGVALASVPR
jgi:methyltransferase (TIGR00027 family)